MSEDNAARFFFEAGRDIAERQGAQIERMVQTIRNYRSAIREECDDTKAAIEHIIAEVERNLSDDDRTRIG